MKNSAMRTSTALISNYMERNTLLLRKSYYLALTLNSIVTRIYLFVNSIDVSQNKSVLVLGKRK